MTKECLICGKEITGIRPSKYNRTKTCSRKCHGKRFSKNIKGISFKGDKHPAWKGGRRSFLGYTRVYAPDHPNASHNFILEHRVIIEKEIGRYLTPKEIVHHVNHIRDDNSVENLMLFSDQAYHVMFEKGQDIPKEYIVFDGRKIKVEELLHSSTI